MLSGGGTGGHVYPALAVVDELKTLAACQWPVTGNQQQATGGWQVESGDRSLDAVLYVGTEGGLEADIVARAGIPFRAVRAGALLGLSPWQALRNVWELLRGSVQAWRILRQFRPSVVLATGGYASAPVALAAWLQGCPVLVYLPDILPGLAIRVLARLAKRVAVSFDASVACFRPGKAVVTGYPVRAALFSGDKLGARQRLGLTCEQKVLLVFGGSRGAHSINQAVSAGLEQLLDKAQIVHISGEKDLSWLQERRAQLPAGLRERYHLFGYLHDEMVDALLAADLAVARAGAATMGEFAAAGLPSILVPYPYAGQHQEANADFMLKRGAALKLPDAELKAGALEHAVTRLLCDENALRCMAENARKLARPDAARAIALQLMQLSRQRASAGGQLD